MADVDAEEQALSLDRWGLRFVSPSTEAAYLEWQRDGSISFNRGALGAAGGSWLSTMVVMAVIGNAAGATVALLLALMCLSTLAITFSSVLKRWMPPAVMVAIAVAGCVSVGVSGWLIKGSHSSTTIAIVIAFFGFALFRLRPAQSALAVAPFMGLDVLVCLQSSRDGAMPGAEAAVWVLSLASTYASGLAINVITDIQARESYRKGRIIEAQKVTIAAERARNEALMQREISHQVAARSRELGASLSRMEGALDGTALAPGDRFDSRYRIVRKLGAGGMGVVFEVERSTDHRALALKVLTGRVSGADAARFAREAEIGARLSHPNLVSIIDIGVSRGVPFLVMELVRGASLESHRADFGSVAWALPILRQVAAGIFALHEGGVVHRDLKPANVLLAQSEGALVARISDFGISKFGEADDPVEPQPGDTLTSSLSQPDANLTRPDAFLGTPNYMPPEAARGAHAVDSAGDVFAFGIMAYELVSGRAPFEQPPVLHAMAGRSLPVVSPLAGLEPTLGNRLLSCLAAEPAQRPRMREIVAVLEKAEMR